MTNCIITGVGGQGTVLLSRLIGASAIACKMNVRGSETIGMAQRGGSVVSHVRMGAVINSPLIPMGKADVAIAFEPGEAVRVYPLLAENATMIVLDKAIKPVTSSLSGGGYTAESMLDFLKRNVKNLIIINADELISICGAKAINTALFGAAVKMGLFSFGLEDAKKSIIERIPQKFHDMNMKAFEAGTSIADSAKQDERI